MTDNQDAIFVFTARSLGRILKEGGSQAWVLNPVNARQCRWLVCAQNRHNPGPEFSDAVEPHGGGFLVGRISAIVPARDAGAGDRWMIEISEYARIDMPGLWNHWRNPVRYTSLAELSIDPAKLEFTAMPPREEKLPVAPISPTNSGLTIAEAKKELAAAFGVRPEAVEITIRG